MEAQPAGGTVATGGGSSSGGGGTAAVGGGAGGGGSTATDSGTPDAGSTCPADAGLPQATGTTRDLMSGSTLASVLAMSSPGDRVRVGAGTFPLETITKAFTGDVFIEAAAGTAPDFNGLTCTGCAHLVFRGVTFTNTLELTSAHDILLDGVTVDVGLNVDASGLYIHGNGDAPSATHDVTVVSSQIHNGARTIFILTDFSPSTSWCNHLTFVGNDFQCGTHNCFQLSGGADVLIQGNIFHDPLGDGVLTAGATRVQILQNLMLGTKSVMTSAVALATPGMEWDNYAGVENMISSDLTVANNVMRDWGFAGIYLEATVKTRIVYNTVINTTGFTTWARVPHDQMNNVIITGNTDVMLWNNIFPSSTPDHADPPVALNVTNLVGTDPQFTDAGDGSLSASSPALDKATVSPLLADGGASGVVTPLVDFHGFVRGPPCRISRRGRARRVVRLPRSPASSQQALPGHRRPRGSRGTSCRARERLWFSGHRGRSAMR